MGLLGGLHIIIACSDGNAADETNLMVNVNTDDRKAVATALILSMSKVAVLKDAVIMAAEKWALQETQNVLKQEGL
jgi:hypothetical protein